MTIKCRDATGCQTELLIEVDGADGIAVAVYDHKGKLLTSLHLDTNSARQLQHGVKACRMGAEARAVSK